MIITSYDNYVMLLDNESFLGTLYESESYEFDCEGFAHSYPIDIPIECACQEECIPTTV